MAAGLLAMIKAFWGLCVFRLAPQDLPASRMLLGLTSAANLLISLLINQRSNRPASAFVDALLELVVVAGLTALLLFGLARRSRIRQTLTALMGSGALLGMIALVALILFAALPDWLYIVIFLWNQCVIGNILRHAFDTGFIVAFFLAISYALVLGMVGASVHQPVT